MPSGKPLWRSSELGMYGEVISYTWKENSPKENRLGRKVRIAQKNIGGIILLAALVFVLLQGALKSYQMSGVEKDTGQASFGSVMVTALAEGVRDALYCQFIPTYAMLEEGDRGNYRFVQGQIGSLLPFYEYMTDVLAEREAATIVLAAEKPVTEKEKGTEQEKGTEREKATGNESVLEAEQATGSGAEEENAEFVENAEVSLKEEISENVVTEMVEESQGVGDEADAALNLAQMWDASAFVPHSRLTQVDVASLSDYETLLQQFYTVDANTSASSERLNVDKFLEKDMSVSKDSAGPQILIFHTHSREGFIDSEEGDDSTTILGVGERLTEILRDTYGYEVIHHVVRYDEIRNDAYAEALPEIEQLLKDNPTIQVVIDLHRDQMPEGTKLVMDLDGRPTARFMFFNGVSRTKKTGNISYLKNENLDYNLAFSFQMQKKAMEYYPGLTRKIYLKGYRYNMHLKEKYLLVELGAQNNTVEEAMNACDPLAHILDMVLSGT